MKIYIVGSVGSGKSTLARRAAKVTGIPCTHLDEVVYEEDPTDSWGNRKRPDEEVEQRFRNILSQPHYIMEDAARERFLDGMAQADQIVVLDYPLRVRKQRIILRWIKQKLGIEKCIYRPHIKMLKAMLRWVNNYETNRDGTKDRIAQFSDKAVYLHNKKDTEQWLSALPRIL